MTAQEQIIAIAELDGRVWQARAVGINLFATQLAYPPEEGFVAEIKTYGDRRLATAKEIEAAILTEFDGLYHSPYLTSRDAIIPVIEKQPKDIQYKILLAHFNKCPIPVTQNRKDHWLSLLFITPPQLAEAMLRATGKWKD